jgi:hypothetical protein
VSIRKKSLKKWLVNYEEEKGEANMKLEKEKALKKYLENLKNRLSAKVPEKHESHPESYKQFLEREIKIVESALEKAKEV